MLLPCYLITKRTLYTTHNIHTQYTHTHTHTHDTIHTTQYTQHTHNTHTIHTQYTIHTQITNMTSKINFEEEPSMSEDDFEGMEEEEDINLESMYTNKNIPYSIQLPKLCLLLSDEPNGDKKQWFLETLKNASHVFTFPIWKQCTKHFMEVMDVSGIQTMLHINNLRNYVACDQLIIFMMTIVSKVEDLDKKKNQLPKFGAILQECLQQPAVENRSIVPLPTGTWVPNANYTNNPRCYAPLRIRHQ